MAENFKQRLMVADASKMNYSDFKALTINGGGRENLMQMILQ